MKRVACFFGTFDPVHVGHLIIAQHILHFTKTQEVWMLVSPQNPFKKDKTISGMHVRMEMLKAALQDSSNIIASDFEKTLPVPSYTCDTLEALRKANPDIQFSLVMGSDNLIGFHGWKNYQSILRHHELLVYPRPGFEKETESELIQKRGKITWINAPQLEISSTHIRGIVAKGKTPRFLVKESVLAIIEAKKLYKS